MSQTLVLLKQAPSSEVLDEWHGSHVVRASMMVNLGCWQWIGFVSAQNTQRFMAMSAESGGDCNMPNPMNCTAAEILAWFQKASMRPPMEEIAFALVTVSYGAREAYADFVRGLAGDLGDDVYVAGGHLLGCGSQNELLEVMADDVDRLQALVVALTDFEGVVDVRLLRGNAAGARDFGAEEQPAETV